MVKAPRANGIKRHLKISCKSSFWLELITQTVLAGKQSISWTSRNGFKLFILPWTVFWDKVGTMVAADPIFAVLPSSSRVKPRSWNHGRIRPTRGSKSADCRLKILRTFASVHPFICQFRKDIGIRFSFLSDISINYCVHPNNVWSETNSVTVCQRTYRRPNPLNWIFISTWISISWIFKYLYDRQCLPNVRSAHLFTFSQAVVLICKYSSADLIFFFLRTCAVRSRWNNTSPCNRKHFFWAKVLFCFKKKLRSVSPGFKPVNQIAILYNTQEGFPDLPGWTLSI